MYFEAQTMAGTVEKALHAAVAFAGFVALFLEEIENLLVYIPAVSGFLHRIKRQFLAALDRMVELSQLFAGASFHDSAGNVAKIAGPLGTGKNIDDDGLIRLQWSVSLLVRIASLHSACHDGVVRQSSRLHNRRVNDGAQFF